MLTKYADLINQGSSVIQQATVVIDPTSDHDLLTLLGWRGNQRMKGNVVHIRLHNQKVWIEEDGLERGVVPDLVEAGIPKRILSLLSVIPKYVR